jgi:hypothetical protein
MGAPRRDRRTAGSVADADGLVRGLGDSVERLTRRTGLDRLAHAYTRATGRPCQCDRRRDWLNRLFPYRRP